jgi:dienelactone hydrolase
VGVQHRFDPDADTLLTWPDDSLTEADPSQNTGRVIRTRDRPWVEPLAPLVKEIAEQADGLSGFAAMGEIWLTFDDALGAPPSGSEASLDGSSLQLWDLASDTRIPFEARLTNADQQLVVTPLQPLALGTEHALVVATDHPAGSQCVAPAMRTVADLEDGVHDDVLDLAALHPNEVGAVVRFTTHDDLGRMIDTAAMARVESQSWSGDFVCETPEGASWRVCQTSFMPADYRQQDGPDAGLVAPELAQRHEVPVTWWLPDTGSPAPVIVAGHGLGAGRNVGDAVRNAELLASLGFAVVAVDALYHHEHPTVEGEAVPLLPFLGINLFPPGVDGRQLRSSFDQSILERLQLITLVQDAPDLDGDGEPDVDPSRLGYVGISLGGLMGAGMMALSSDIEMGALPVGGARITEVVAGTDALGAFIPLLEEVAGSREAFELYLSVVQTLIDPADPGLWAARVLDDRVVEGDAPDVLLPVARYDEVVVPEAGRAYARAFPLPHIPPVAEPVDGLEPGPATPIHGNHPSGATVGFFQFDRVTLRRAEVDATHSVPESDEAQAQLEHFVLTWREGRTEIIAP